MSEEKAEPKKVDAEHYKLTNGEEMNREHPGTFHIPDLGTRVSVQVGGLVKLGFMFADSDSGERMWVKVTSAQTDGKTASYTGTIDNDPITTDLANLGDIVEFNHTNIIGVYND